MASSIQPSLINRARLQLAAARRCVRQYGVRPLRIVGALSTRPIFVVGSPRSGTSFTAEAMGSVTGFADLGEVNLLKASVPFLHSLGPDQSTRHVLCAFNRAQRLGMIAGMRPIEQTPELTFLMRGIVRAYPEARILHLVRDGRDVVCSLVERGWLCDSPSGVALARGTGTTHDDAGQPFGNYARFWVEPKRRAEFEAASEVTRAAWAWRRYTSAGLDQAADLPAGSVLQVRYEQLVTDTRRVALEIVDFLGERERADEFVSAFGKAHTRSHGRWRQELEAEQITEIENEAGPLLTELGYA